MKFTGVEDRRESKIRSTSISLVPHSRQCIDKKKRHESQSLRGGSSAVLILEGKVGIPVGGAGYLVGRAQSDMP